MKRTVCQANNYHVFMSIIVSLNLLTFSTAYWHITIESDQKIKSLLYSRYYAEACDERWGPSWGLAPGQHSSEETSQWWRVVGEWRHYVQFDPPGNRTSLSLRKAWGSISGPIKSNIIAWPTTRHRCDVSSELCCPRCKSRGWPPPLVPRFGVIP